MVDNNNDEIYKKIYGDNYTNNDEYKKLNNFKDEYFKKKFDDNFINNYEKLFNNDNDEYKKYIIYLINKYIYIFKIINNEYNIGYNDDNNNNYKNYIINI